ncbi:MAG TPA: hypothetical protein VGE52_19295, partial [Pirellulales bacterium]
MKNFYLFHHLIPHFRRTTLTLFFLAASSVVHGFEDEKSPVEIVNPPASRVLIVVGAAGSEEFEKPF